MNWELVKWFAGILLTVAGLKFVVVAFKSIFSKDNMQDVLEAVGDKVSDASKKTTNKLKKAFEKNKKKRRIKRAQRQNKPIVYIR